MARVYVSSTVLDLKAERAAVFQWLAEHHHEGVHSYVADAETVRTSCLADVASCDVYVLMVGRRYGFIPDDGNPKGLSISELEYEAALDRRKAAGMPIVVLKLAYLPSDPGLTDLDNLDRYTKLMAFRQRLSAAHRPAEIKSLAELIPAFDAALSRLLPEKPLEHPEVAAMLARLTMAMLRKDERIETLEREIAQLRVLHGSAMSAQPLDTI